MWRALPGVVVAAFLSSSIALASDAPKTLEFTLQVPDIVTASFTKVSGLSLGHVVVEHNDGSVDRKLPGRRTYGDITLTRAMTGEKNLWRWAETVDAFGRGAANGSIVLSDRAGREIARWHLVNAWPAKVEISVDAETGVVEESVTIAVEALIRR